MAGGFGAVLWSPVSMVFGWVAHWEPGRVMSAVLLRSTDFFMELMWFDGQDYTVGKGGRRGLIRTWPSTKTLVNPVWWFIWCGLFFWRWLLTRPYIPMLLAIPALAVVLSFFSAASAGGRISKGTEAIHFRRLLLTATTNNQIEVARLASDALVRLYPNSEEYAFNRATIEAQAGNDQTAKALMSELATSKKSAQAALWLANSVGDRKDFGNWSDEDRKAYVRWLSLAVENDPTSVLPRRLLSDVLLVYGDNRGAYTTLLPVADADEDITYIVTFLEKELGMLEAARGRAEKLTRVYKDRLSETPQDIAARSRYAALFILREQYAEAVDLLKRGLVLASTPEDTKILRNAIAEAMVLESTMIADTDQSPRGLMRSLERLREAMAVDPTNPSLLEAVAQACLRAADSKNDELIVLREALVQGVSSDTAHFILGTVALNAGDIEEAKQHLEIAVKSNPNLPGLLNNLAHAISHEEEPDLERALRLSDAAVANLPNHAYLRETRGQIYFKLKRYTEAIADLEIALSAKELRPRIRESLATAYDALGRTDIAERQRELLKLGR